MIDYKLLLEKYMAHVGDLEGVTFVLGDWDFDNSHVPFTEKEKKELRRLDKSSYEKWTRKWDKQDKP